MKRTHPKFNFILGIILLFAIAFSIITLAQGATPNPGHGWAEVGDGFFIIAGPTSAHTYTFPDANATMLANPMTANGDIIYGATGGAGTRLAGDTSNVRKFLREQSVAGQPQPPVWDSLTAADIPDLSGTYSLKAGSSSITAVGTLTSGSVGTGFTAIADAQIASAATWNGKQDGSANLTSLAGLTYSAPAFVKMTGANTFTLDTSGGGGGMTNPMTTQGDIIYGGASGAPARLGGVADGYLKSGGATGAPTWATGKILTGRKIITATSYYVPTAGTTAIFLQMCGPGGGGAGAYAGGTTSAMVGGGGGSGAYMEKYITFSSLSPYYTVTVNLGGNGGVMNAAGSTPTGGTSFACDATCSGGAATLTVAQGNGGATPTAAGTTVAPSFGGAGGAAGTGGDVNAAGHAGDSGMRFSGTVFTSGAGGPSYFSAGGGPVTASATGIAGTACAGGGGAASNSYTAQLGGKGGDGLVIIWEYK
jgi:hypothetical protein